MSKKGIIIGLLCAVAVCSVMDKKTEGGKETKKGSSTPSSEATLIGVATVSHTKYAETNYNLPSWEWSKADIYTYDNGWNNVKFYVQDKDEPIESNWYPCK